MDGTSMKKGLPWLVGALLLLLTSTALYIFDQRRDEADILGDVNQALQRDFDVCLALARGDTLPGYKNANCALCELNYNKYGRLLNWSNTSFLPSQKSINRLRAIADSQVVQLENRAYYQVRTEQNDTIKVVLLPLRVSYDIKNQFLQPYYYLGRSQSVFTGIWRDKLRAIQTRVGGEIFQDGFEASEKRPPILSLQDDKSQTILQLTQVPSLPFRIGIRYAVLVFLALAVLSFLIYLRIYTLDHYENRYWVNLGLIAGIAAIWGLAYGMEIPRDYIGTELFSPNILAFHDLAPSLGDLTINIFVLCAVIWVLYVHVFRTSNWVYRKVLQRAYLAWPMMIAGLFFSVLLMEWSYDLFANLTEHSQVDIEFSNIFKTNIYSYLILLDVGILFLGISLVIFTLVKLNVLFLNRYKGELFWTYLLVQVAFLFFFCVIFFPTRLWLAALTGVGLVGLAYTVFRKPFKPILYQDVGNYIAIILVFSALVTYHVVEGINTKNAQRAVQIADRVVGSQAANTVFGFGKGLSRLKAEQNLVRQKLADLGDYSDFRDWVVARYFAPNLKEFEVSLFLYSHENKALDDYSANPPSLGPETGVPLMSRGERVSDEYELYQLPNPDNRYIDLYAGAFYLFMSPDTAYPTRFLLELAPNRQEVKGLYPSLSLDQQVYEDLSLISSFDHAIYRDGILSNDRGAAPFPTFMLDYRKYKEATTVDGKGFKEYIQPLGNKKLIVVRYPLQKVFDVLTTFSLTFYFYNLAALALILLPVLAFRLLQTKKFTTAVPLRAKIRVGLLAISILPLVVISVLLYPFVSQRYNQDAQTALSDETRRIADLVTPSYRTYKNDPFSLLTLQTNFREEIEKLEGVVGSDLNVFDQDGKRIASTQPAIFENGISTDLMNAVALDSLKNSGGSELILEERVGDLEYLSAYRPIIGNYDYPIGYINVPYLNQQDQLENQVIGFLAYLANIYLLAFLLLNVVSVVVSSTITKPLSMIQERLAATGLGGSNEPIDYDSEDEIGEIVRAYNKMVGQLVESEEKLTQNQREMAWRQMARQVAHEIKNPLTPMRLSIQHLSRAWDEKGVRLEKMFPKVMKTLLVQIDSLVRIANSFSEFAKMPEPVKTHIRVNDVLLEVVDLYTQSEEAIWLIDIPKVPFMAYADRDQLSRCFNNIIKNGLQAVDDNGIIHVSMRVLKDRARIEIRDNGKGIPEDILKRIFEPSFSTKTSGMGLGLAIVKRIIENIGGEISVRSKVGEGSTFIIELPAIEEPEPVYVVG